MAEACPGSTKSSLEDIQAWYIHDETYSAALAELVNAQGKRPLAAFWGDAAASLSDGQNFRTGSSGRYAGQGRLTRNMDTSPHISFIPIFRINANYFPGWAKFGFVVIR